MKARIYIYLIILCFQSVLVFSRTKEQSQNTKISTTMNDSINLSKKAKALAGELREKGIKDEGVLAAIEKIPRHVFVAKSLVRYAYDDRPLPIDKNQTISQPYTVAFQTELLQLNSGEKVLEIGTGSGYQAAVLCEMNVEVYSIERYEELHLKAKKVLEKLGYKLNLFYGDGYEGLPEHAPFDKILITAAVKEVPEELLKQLKVGGLLVAPVGGSNGQTMTVVERISEDKYKKTKHGAFTFVPMKKGKE